MPEFTYAALNEDGSATTGRISAESFSEAVTQLETQGLLVTSIQKAADEVSMDVNAPTARGPTAAELALGKDQQVLRQRIAEVLEHRTILAPALAAFAEELPSGRSRRELRALVTRLQSDATVDNFCSSDDRTASWLLLLGRGTGSHRLLSALFDEATRENESQSQWNRAFIYPACVFLGSLGVLIFLCISVVPVFSSSFDDFDIELPVMTSWVVAISNAILRNTVSIPLWTLAFMAVAYVIFRLIHIWGLPGRLGNMLTMGNSWQVTAMAQFTRQLAESLDAGLELPASLRLAGEAGKQSTMRRLALRLADEAEQENFDLSSSPVARRLPTSVVHALQAGSDNVPSIPLLRKLADLYTTRVRDRHNWSNGFMAQLAIVGLGLTVGFVVLALFLPMVSLINGLTG